MRRFTKAVFIAVVILAAGIFVKGSITQPAIGGWLPAGSMTVARSAAASALLQDGRILITGGDNGSGPVASAEVFDTTGAFVAVAPMGTARSAHSATVLIDGRILVAGGSTSAAATNAAEIFDPVTNTWTPVAGGMIQARSHHTASLLADGRVLFAGGDNAGTPTASLEVFDPVANSFSSVGAMTFARTSFGSAILSDGRVMFIGGSNGSAPVASTEIFDPVSNTDSAGPALSMPRMAHSATTLLDGRVLVAGGTTVVTNPDGSTSNTDLASAEIYDPATGNFAASTSSLAAPRRDHAAFLLPNNNSVLIVGGTSAGAEVATAEIFVPSTGIFAVTGSPSAARQHATGSALSLDGILFLAGGSNSTGTLSSAELYGFATVKTDKADYAPGTIVTITGSGWQPGETVTLTLVESPLIDTHPVLTAVADSTGKILNNQFSPDAHDISIRFYLTAVGSVSGIQAQNTFTDAGVNKITSVGAQNPTPIAAGNSATYSVTVSFNGNGTACNATLSTSGLPSGATASFAPFPSGNPANTITSTGANVTTTLTVSTTAGMTPGTTTFTITATPSSGCSGGTASTNPSGTGGNAANPMLAVSKAVSTTTFGAAPTPTYLGGNFTVSASNNSGAPITYSPVSGPCTLASGATFSSSGAGSCVVQANSAATADYLASSAQQTVTIAKATPTISWSNPADITYGTALSSTQLNATTASTAGTFVYTPAAGTLLASGSTQNLRVDFTPTDTTDYSTASKEVTINVAKATAVVVVAPYNVTYDGNAHSATVTSITGVNGETGATVGTVDVSNTAHTPAGTYSSDSWSFTGTANYNNIAATTITDTINKATAVVVVAPYTVTYDGHAHSATVTSITGVNGETGATVGTVDVSNTAHTPAGTYSSDSWSFTGTANYNNIAATTITDTINKATAVVVVAPYTVTYDGHAHSATVTSITGVNGETGATVGTVDVSNTAHTPAGTYSSDSWSFTGTANYNNIAATTITDTINKATAVVVVAPYTVTYDGHAHSATVTSITGVNGETGATVGTVDVSNTAHTPAGTYSSDSWSFTGTANYNNIAATTITDTINKATAVVVVAPYTVTYDGHAHSATVTSITGVNGETGATVGTVDVSNTAHTPAGTYSSDSWSFTGTANYNNIAATTITDTINKATAVVVVAPYTVTYDGHAHSATVTSITGVNGETGATVGTVDVSNTAHTPAGTYSSDSWSFTGTANYNNIAATTITDTINKATAVVVVAPYTVTYDGHAHSATVTSITGVNGETGATVGTVDVSNTAHTPAGTYSSDSWSFTGTANYNNIAATTITDTINKATAVVVVAPYTVTYDGHAHSATVTSITGVNGETGATVGTVDVSNTAHTPAGTYSSDSWSFTGTANYNNIAATTITDTINKATAVVVVAPYTVTYDGHAHSATVTSITGVNGETGATVGTVDVSNTAHTPAGTYSSDSWSFTGTANYNNIAATTITDTINKATAVVVVAPYTVTYDGHAHSATVTSITGVNGETGATVGTVDVSNTAHTPAGTYSSDSWSFTGTANYNNIAATTITDTINKATAVVVVAPYTVTYDGHAHSATVTSITGVNGETGATVGTVDVSNTAHTPAGTYSSDSWSFTGTANYNNIAATTITDTINKATAVVVVAPYTVTYDGHAHSATVTSITGVNGETGATVGTVDVSNTAHTPAGTYSSDSWSFTGTANYNNIAATTITDTINKATAVVVVAPYTVTYDGHAHSATVTSITGVNGETGATVGTVTLNTSHTAAGTYSSDSWSFTGTANYNNIAATTITDTINKATAVVVVAPYTVTYDGNAHSATVTSITGVNGETGATVGTVDVSNTAHTPAGTYSSDSWSFTGTANYNNIAATTITDTINKATAVVVVAPYTVTYDGNAHSATVTSITGVNGETGATVGTVTLNTSHTAAGTYSSDSWSFTGTANYNNIAATTITDTINKATAVVVVAPYTVTYDGNAHSATVTSITGVNGETGATVGTVTLNTSHTAAGTYSSDSWSFTGAANYNNIAATTITDTINKATAVVVVAPYTVTYDGNAHSATVTSITGVNGETGATVGTVDVSNTAHTPAGTYSSDSWSFTGTANYNNIAATTITDTINKATAVVVVAPYTVTYDGNAHSATVTSITGVNGETGATVGTVTLNTSHTAAGTYSSDSWSFTGAANYNNIAATTITDTINKATAVVVVAPYTVTYDGNAHSATVTSITGVNGETGATVGTVTLNTSHTAAGTYSSDSWSFTGTANYNNIAATTITDTINKATAVVVVAPYTVTYDGNAHSATVTSITGVNGETGATVGTVTLNTSHTAAGTYSSDSWSFTGTANYNNIAATTITDTISQAMTVIASIASSANPSVYDQTVTFSTTVNNMSNGFLVGEGTVTFMDGGTPICVAPILGGTGTCPYSGLSIGTHSVSAMYYDSLGNFTSSLTMPNQNFNQVVNARHTSVTITSTEIFNFATGSVPIDTTVHLQVTVTDDDPNGTPITPTGTFPITSLIASDTFSPNDNTGNGSCVLSGSGASASCMLTVTPVEADLHELTANYPGDSVHLASTQNADMTVTAPLVSQKVCLDAPFNGTAIPAGSTVWFNAVFQTTGQKITTLTHLTFYKQTIQIGNGTPMPVPDGVITFDPSAAYASTTFDAADDRWNTILPTYNLAAKNWLSGMPVQLPSGLAGSTAPVTWCGQFDSDSATIALGWQWAAAVYSSNSNFALFDPNNPASYNLNLIGVKAVDDNKADVNYKNSDHAGTPENFLKFVIGGARGGGGGNYTGGYSGSGNVK